MRIRWIVPALCCVAALALPAAASAEDPPFVDWASLAPSLSTKYEPTSENECTSGKLKCVDAVIREMSRRFEPLKDACDHNAIFALGYLRTTEEYRRATTTPGFFEDPGFVNHEDAVFANYYMKAYDAWKAGRRSEVPAAWRIALDAARDRQVSANGNMVLGMNAHIMRDLPYVLAGIGLVKPDGSTRKTDHDKVNEFLNKVNDGLNAEFARRFDPTADDGNAPTWIDDMATFQSVPAMRESAWRHAEALVNAPTPAARALVETTIENEAATSATAIKMGTAYAPLQDGAAARDRYCAVHKNDL